ncbi:hypothetical protein K438DRAFT_1807643 [Mycena galopus ATCC 62051]|nr:hypothetical protein K438DRAFT_1807643 [Mycena galopus ATCC 62051]
MFGRRRGRHRGRGVAMVSRRVLRCFRSYVQAMTPIVRSSCRPRRKNSDAVSASYNYKQRRRLHRGMDGKIDTDIETQ